jgi:hypothetical protein
MYQNKMEQFLTEGFDSRLLDRFTKESISEEENALSNIMIPISEEPQMNIPVTQEEPQMNIPVIQEEPQMNIPVTQEEYSQKVPVMEEEYSQKVPVMEEEMMNKIPVMEEESYQKYAPVNDIYTPIEKPSISKPSATPNGDKKAKEAIDKQDERPDINKHIMDDGNRGLSNRNTDTLNPININVSYNNNRPFTVNDFNNPDIDKNTLNGKKITDINSYRFDDGCMNRSVKSGIDNMNQKYFPAYLENPLNKNQPKVDDNYEMKMMKRILNEQNDPSPVLLENPWSEWKPLDK